MPGVGNMMIGLGICLIGIVVTAATYNAPVGGHYVVAYGAIIGGGFQFLMGLFQWMSALGTSRTEKTDTVDPARVDINVLVRSMVATAAADGSLADNEVSMIQLVCRQVAGADLEAGAIKEVFEEMKSHDFAQELSHIGSHVTSEGAEMPVKCSLMVAYADGDFDASEEVRVKSIAKTLGVTGERFTKCAQEAMDLCKAIFAASASQASPASATSTS